LFDRSGTHRLVARLISLAADPFAGRFDANAAEIILAGVAEVSGDVICAVMYTLRAFGACREELFAELCAGGSLPGSSFCSFLQGGHCAFGSFHAW
jgi:hypothetical protein